MSLGIFAAHLAHGIASHSENHNFPSETADLLNPMCHSTVNYTELFVGS